MSLLTEVGAQVRATADQLPIELVAVAMEKLRAATELLAWVRETSVDPLGVPQLGGATEHAERAAHALHVAQDTLAGYLAAIGLAADLPAPVPEQRQQEKPRPEVGTAPPPGAASGPLASWWRARVGQLTGETEQETGEADERGAADTGELLRRLASGVRARDRARVARELRAVDAATGLNLSAVAAPVLTRLAGDLLGHEPRPQDLSRLRDAAGDRVRALLPGGGPEVDALLARVCRTPITGGEQVHPADSAVTSGVLAGVLLARLGRGPEALTPAHAD